MKLPTWFLVADRARARILEGGADRTLTEVACFVEPAARAAEATLTDDRPPTVNESVGMARHSIEPHTPLRDKITARFARTLCDALEAGRNEGRFENLVLVAPPRFLGALRAQLGESLSACIEREVRHDFTSLATHELGERLSR
jgi:protein required for attachment to host cells